MSSSNPNSGQNYGSSSQGQASINVTGAANIGSGVSTTYTYNAAGSYSTGVGIGGSVIVSADEINALLRGAEASRPSLVLGVESGEPRITFYQTDASGDRLRAIFEPESGMTISELSRVMQLVMVMQSSQVRAELNPIDYLRTHNLERHFRFSAA